MVNKQENQIVNKFVCVNQLHRTKVKRLGFLMAPQTRSTLKQKLTLVNLNEQKPDFKNTISSHSTLSETRKKCISQKYVILRVSRFNNVCDSYKSTPLQFPKITKIFLNLFIKRCKQPIRYGCFIFNQFHKSLNKVYEYNRLVKNSFSLYSTEICVHLY